MTQDKSNKNNQKTIADPQKGKFKKYPRPTQGTALMSNNSFYPWKKKVKKGGCGRHSHFDLWRRQVITNVHKQDLSTSKILTRVVNIEKLVGNVNPS